MSVASAYSMVNGTRINHTYDSASGTWKAAGTAPLKSSYSQPNHVYTVTTYATDDAGNTSTQNSTLRVLEKVAPVITIAAPTASALITNNKPAITFKVTDDDSGVNPDTIGITIDSGSKITGSAITKTAVTGGYECSYTPTSALADGSHTVKVDASDNDGNTATQKSVTFKIDTVPPTLSISSPTDKLITKNTSITVSGKTNDATSSPVTVKVNGAAVTVDASGNFTTTVSLKEGSNTITVVATDSAGKSTTITRTVTLDTKAPVFTKVEVTPDPVAAGGAITITATITD